MSGNTGKIRVTLKKSLIGTKAPHRETVRGLGLRRLNQTVELENTVEIRGMVTSVAYLLRVEG